MSWSAWARLPSASRSHSQASSRAGWPKIFQERVVAHRYPGNCVARVPAGSPANFSGRAVASQRASSSTSALSSFVTAWLKYLVSVLVRLVRLRRKLVRPRDQDRLHQVAQVVLVPGEIGLASASSNSSLAARVRFAEVVDRIDDAPCPSGGTRRGWPRSWRRTGCSGFVSQSANAARRSAPLAEPRRSPLPGKRGGICLAGTRLRHFAVAGGVDHLGRSRPCSFLACRAGHRVGLPLHPGEDRGEAVVVVLAPALERVVVALGALHPHAEE